MISVLVLIGAACGSNSPRSNSFSGAQDVSIVGTVSEDLLARSILKQDTCSDQISVFLNGRLSRPDFASDCSFVMRKPLEGNVDLKIRIRGFSDNTFLEELREGEVLQLEVQRAPGGIRIHTVRRMNSSFSSLDASQSILDDADQVRRDQVFYGPVEFPLDDTEVIGQAGEHLADCNSEGWTSFQGTVRIHGENAYFQNIRFDGPVITTGDNVSFFQCCFGDRYVSWGKRLELGD